MSRRNNLSATANVRAFFPDMPFYGLATGKEVSQIAGGLDVCKIFMCWRTSFEDEDAEGGVCCGQSPNDYAACRSTCRNGR